MNKISISDNIAVIAEPQFAQYISGIAHTYTDEKKLLIVLADRKLSQSECRTNLNGVTDALAHAESDAQQQVLLLSILPLEYVLEKKEDFALFLQLPNTFFGRIPLTQITLEKEVDADVIKMGVIKSLAGLLRTLNHTTEKYLNADEDTIHGILAQRSVEVKRAQAHFSELQGLTGKEFITELKKLCTILPIQQVMPGKEISGVYCDIEGTLLVGGSINGLVSRLLQSYEKEGLPITIWTLGNVSEFEPIIRSAGIQYPVRSKMDYSGAIAEIVIDNDSEETFRTKTQITPKQFIRVQ